MHAADLTNGTTIRFSYGAGEMGATGMVIGHAPSETRKMGPVMDTLPAGAVVLIHDGHDAGTTKTIRNKATERGIGWSVAA